MSKVLSPEQVMLLENLTYLNMDNVKSGESLTEFLSSIDMSSVGDNLTTRDEWQTLINAVKADPELQHITIASTNTDWGTSGSGGGFSALFINEDTGEGIVAYRGTAADEWADDFEGGGPMNTADGVSTPQQENALNWYQKVTKEHDLTSITVTGHSKGGNKAKYVTEAENRNLIVNRQLEMNILLMGPIIIAIILLLPIAIPLLYNSQFLGVLGMTQIAAAGLLWKAFYLPLEYIPLSRGEARIFLVQECCCVLLLIVSEIIGYLWYGLDGLGAGIVVAYVLESIGVFVFCHVHYAYRLSFLAGKHLVVHLLNLLLIGGVVWLWDADSWGYWLLGLFLFLDSLAYSLSKIHSSLKQ